jgi:hypothetical protein
MNAERTYDQVTAERISQTLDNVAIEVSTAHHTSERAAYTDGKFTVAERDDLRDQLHHALRGLDMALTELDRHCPYLDGLYATHDPRGEFEINP